MLIKVDNEMIEDRNTVKLLGITIDNQLNFTEHLTQICNKASTKLHALARVSNFMNPQKVRLLTKAFINQNLVTVL